MKLRGIPAPQVQAFVVCRQITRDKRTGDLPPFNVTSSRENLVVEQTKGGNQKPRRKKELADQITPELREVEVEVRRGKIVLEAVNKIGVTEQAYYR